MLRNNPHHNHRISIRRMALPCTVPPVWLELPDLLFNRETLNSPSSKPSRTVLFFEVMYTTDARQRC